MFFTRPVSMPTAEQALPGRPEAILRPGRHTVLDRPIAGPYPEGTEIAVFDPKQVSYEQLLKVFWESHDPTQGMRQGNDVGTQYRSVIFCHTDDRRRATEASRDLFRERLRDAGYGQITTEIVGPPAPAFYFAEDYHQQYLDKNPRGYCPDHSTGVSCPVGLFATSR